MYCKCGEIDTTHELFDGMKEKDLISWNTMIDGYSYLSLYAEAHGTVTQSPSFKPGTVTQSPGFKPGTVTQSPGFKLGTVTQSPGIKPGIVTLSLGFKPGIVTQSLDVKASNFAIFTPYSHDTPPKQNFKN